MLKFSFQNTTTIHFGVGQIEKITAAIPKDARILITYGGGSIKHNGIFDQVKTALKNHHWQEFSGIKPNPQYDALMPAVDLIKQEKLNYILAVGGGSVIDASKFLAAAALFKGEDPWHMLSQRAKFDEALPLGCVVTLPATGSETNTGSVITRGQDKLSFMRPCLRPAFAVLDPQVTLSLSERQVGNGVVDAFVHVTEQYLTYSVNGKVQDRFAEGLLQTLIEDGPRALSEPNNLDVRGNLMWAATQALNGLIGAGVPQDWSTHMIGHELTALFHVDHARSLSVLLPSMLKVQKEAKREKLLQYAQRVWNISQGTEDEQIDEAIRQTEHFFHRMKVPTRLSELELSSEDIPKILKQLELHRLTALGEHRNIDLIISEQVLKQAL